MDESRRRVFYQPSMKSKTAMRSIVATPELVPIKQLCLKAHRRHTPCIYAHLNGHGSWKMMTRAPPSRWTSRHLNDVALPRPS
jgi:hypothetical protein